ncbi:RHS repeat-associated core domain-containing protein [Pseudomonas shirazensis]
MFLTGARYQDPKLRIFISVDPLAEKYKGVSSYAYALNNPVKFVDTEGRDIAFTQTIREDGTKVITMTVTGKLINESNKSFTSKQMKAYAESLSNGIK